MNVDRYHLTRTQDAILDAKAREIMGYTEGDFLPTVHETHASALQDEIIRRSKLPPRSDTLLLRYAAILYELVSGADEWRERFVPGKNERTEVAAVLAMLRATPRERTLAFLLALGEK